MISEAQKAADAIVASWHRESANTPQAANVAIRIVRELLISNAVFPHPYFPESMACEIVRRILLEEVR